MPGPDHELKAWQLVVLPIAQEQRPHSLLKAAHRAFRHRGHGCLLLLLWEWRRGWFWVVTPPLAANGPRIPVYVLRSHPGLPMRGLPVAGRALFAEASHVARRVAVIWGTRR